MHLLHWLLFHKLTATKTRLRTSKDTVIQVYNPLLEPLRALILEESLLPASEHQLLSALTRRGVLSADYSADSLALFRANFLCMNALYQLRKEWRTSRRGELRISPLIVEWQAVSRDHMSPRQVSAETDALAGYYLDWKNFSSATTESVARLLNEFWSRYLSIDQLEDALAVLDLQPPVALPQIRARYRSLAMQLHPDRGGDSEEFSRLQSAYSVLRQYFD